MLCYLVLHTFILEYKLSELRYVYTILNIYSLLSCLVEMQPHHGHFVYCLQNKIFSNATLLSPRKLNVLTSKPSLRVNLTSAFLSQFLAPATDVLSMFAAFLGVSNAADYDSNIRHTTNIS